MKVDIQFTADYDEAPAMIAYLLRSNPLLTFTLKPHERIPTPAGTPQTYFPDARAARDAAFREFTDRDNEFRALEAAGPGRVGADSDAERAWNETRLAAVVALEADAASRATPGGTQNSYPWKPGEHTEAAADARIEADAAAAERDYRAEVHRGDNNEDDDSAYQ